MIYRELDKIPLSRFIDVYLGDTDLVAEGGNYSREEKEEAAGLLCSRYLSIVGGRSMLSVIARRDEELRVRMRLTCLCACRELIGYGEYERAREVLSWLGYPFPSADPLKMLEKVDGLSASDKYRLARMEETEKGLRSQGVKKMDRSYFTRERVAVMGHMKMYIDPEQFSAEEYAWMVKRTCEDVEEMMKLKIKN